MFGIGSTTNCSTVPIYVLYYYSYYYLQILYKSIYLCYYLKFEKNTLITRTIIICDNKLKDKQLKHYKTMRWMELGAA